MWLWVLAGVSVVLAWYVVWGRPWLRDKPSTQAFFQAIEPYEIALWQKSETILWARLQHVFAVLLLILPQIGAFNVQPYLQFVPEKHRWVVMLTPSIALMLNGIITELLRKDTTKPLALVAMSTEERTPKVEKALERFETAKEKAVEIVEETHDR